MPFLNFLLNTISSVLTHASAPPNVADLHNLIDGVAEAAGITEADTPSSTTPKKTSQPSSQRANGIDNTALLQQIGGESAAQ